MIADMLCNKNLNSVTTELFFRGRKLSISFVFITQFHFSVPKNIRLNSEHYFIMKIANKLELQLIVFNHLSDIDFKELMNLKKMHSKTILFLVVVEKNYLEIMQKITMKINEKIRDEKLLYDVNWKAAKISAISSG